MASRCLMPNAPWPARHTFMTCPLAPVLENHVPDRGVRGGDMVEAINFLGVIVERAARNEPHHQLDAFRARFAHILKMRNLDERLRIRGEAIEEAVVEG